VAPNHLIFGLFFSSFKSFIINNQLNLSELHAVAIFKNYRESQLQINFYGQ
jgi:hypothetical protein